MEPDWRAIAYGKNWHCLVQDNKVKFQVKFVLQLQLSTVPSTRPWVYDRDEHPIMHFSETGSHENFGWQVQT